MSSSSSTSSSFGSISSSNVPFSIGTAADVEDDFNAPLWKYVTKLVRRARVGGGNTKCQCNLCNVEFQGSYFRVEAHLLLGKNQGIRISSFVNGKPDILDEIRKLNKEAENRQKMAQPKPVPLPLSASQFNAIARVGNLGTENVSGLA
ncbi:hypothetical protein Vadar_001931 [Vaccinium darrowii]|uniref:Uncharacterized protein n=1 Tax=Vaccinium darrowii TaxID=229202 RepID=A0ACB7WWW6_9ERIC|nr:hypothetical protein Vadar_001931 [Vaccinium darrowii]